MYMLQILADDMGQWAAYKDQNPEIIHPTLDKLIAEGTSFENSACNTPVCSASRATWFTGRLPSQHNVHDWISRGNGCPGDAPALNYSQGEVFPPDILTSLGYTAGISGKVHLGNQPVPQHGFSRDHYFVHQVRLVAAASCGVTCIACDSLGTGL
jgi:arylsulfatase A-like enzyme